MLCSYINRLLNFPYGKFKRGNLHWQTLALVLLTDHMFYMLRRDNVHFGGTLPTLVPTR